MFGQCSASVRPCFGMFWSVLAVLASFISHMPHYATLFYYNVFYDLTDLAENGVYYWSVLPKCQNGQNWPKEQAFSAKTAKLLKPVFRHRAVSNFSLFWPVLERCAWPTRKLAVFSYTLSRLTRIFKTFRPFCLKRRWIARGCEQFCQTVKIPAHSLKKGFLPDLRHSPCLKWLKTGLSNLEFHHAKFPSFAHVLDETAEKDRYWAEPLVKTDAFSVWLGRRCRKTWQTFSRFINL